MEKVKINKQQTDFKKSQFYLHWFIVKSEVYIKKHLTNWLLITRNEKNKNK